MEIGKFYSFKIKGWQGNIYGVVCALSPVWILVKVIVDDFRYDGFAIIQMKHIKEWIYDEKVAFREQVLRTKGIMDIPFPTVPLDSPNAPFSWFVQQKEIVFFIPKDESEAFMGKIIEVTKKKIDLHPVFADGTWNIDIWDFFINDIVVVEWQSHYIRSLMKYSRTICS